MLAFVALWTVAMVADAAGETGSATPVELRVADAPTGTFQDVLDEKLHAADDEGWQTEVLSSAAGAVLKKLVGQLSDLESVTAADLEPYLAKGFSTHVLRPAELDVAYRQGEWAVRRWAGESSISSPAELRGADGFVEALSGLADGLRLQEPYEKLKKKVKAIRVEPGDDDFATTFLVKLDVRHAGGSVQQNAIWTTRWTTRWTDPAGPDADGDAAPQLLRIELDSFEEAELRLEEASASTLFADATASAFAGVEAYDTQVRPALEHWFPRVGRLAGMSFLGHHGVAVGDVNGDGLEDVYVTDAAGLPNRLYLQQEDGSVRDASAESGTDWLDPSISALLVDLDDDGDPDLVVATAYRLLLHENDGSGRFTLRESLLEVVTAPTSLSAADYDEDGDLDLYLCGYNGDRDSRAIPGPVPYHDAKNGGRNALLENVGGFRFEDVTQRVGLDENNHSYSFAAAWDDYDDDGDVDLYVANDFGRNNLYENFGGRFRDVAETAGVQDVASGMSASWGDFDRDGRRDMYVANMFSSAGNRVAYQRRFAGGDVSDQTLADIRRMARGNTLFRNVGDGTFDDVTMDAGVYLGLWAWASRFGDLNNDGWLDLVIANGYVTNRSTNDL